MSEIPVIAPYWPEDFSVLWPADYQDKTVLDIGADRGSTASYFLRNGARFVICVEGDPNRFRELEANLPSLRNAKAVFKWITSPSDMTELLWCNSADIVKIDVEGAEQYLFGVEPYMIQQHTEYMVEVHPGVNIDEMVNLFRQCGFDVTLGAVLWFFYKIIHCKKR